MVMAVPSGHLTIDCVRPWIKHAINQARSVVCMHAERNKSIPVSIARSTERILSLTSDAVIHLPQWYIVLISHCRPQWLTSLSTQPPLSGVRVAFFQPIRKSWSTSVQGIGLSFKLEQDCDRSLWQGQKPLSGYSGTSEWNISRGAWLDWGSWAAWSSMVLFIFFSPRQPPWLLYNLDGLGVRHLSMD